VPISYHSQPCYVFLKSHLLLDSITLIILREKYKWWISLCSFHQLLLLSLLKFQIPSLAPCFHILQGYFTVKEPTTYFGGCKIVLTGNKSWKLK
jgi:hypothetical protein